jgi:hypothetical protein
MQILNVPLKTQTISKEFFPLTTHTFESILLFSGSLTGVPKLSKLTSNPSGGSYKKQLP